MSIIICLDALLLKKGITGKELSEKIKITEANLSILRSGHAKAIRFSTLEKICDELGCNPGDLIKYQTNHLKKI